MKFNLTDLAQLVGAKIWFPEGASEDQKKSEVTGVGPIESAGPTILTFLTNSSYAHHLEHTKAAAVIVAKPIESFKRPQIVHGNPYWAFAKIAQQFYQPSRSFGGVSKQAFIASSASIGENVTIYPFAYIGEGAKIGSNAVLHSGVYVGDKASIGESTELRANVVVEYGCVVGARVLIHAGSVIGADGFGFAPAGPAALGFAGPSIAKIPQVGIVRIEDDVEIGGLSTVDRAAFGETHIGCGTKLDSHVHVGHNVTIGKDTMLCGFAGIAGSAKLGNRVVIAGHSAVNNHVAVGDDVILGAMSAITVNTPEAGTYMGFPAQPDMAWRRQQAGLRRLQDFEKKLLKRIADLEAKVADLSS